MGFQPTACRLSSARNCLFAVKSVSISLSLSCFLSLFLSFALSRLHLRPSPSPSLSLFSRGSFPVPAKAQRIHGFLLLSATRANVSRGPRRDGTSRVFRTRTWLAHVTSAIQKDSRGSKIFFHLSTRRCVSPRVF